MFQQTEKSTTEELTQILLHTNHSFFITVEASLFGIDCIILQMNNAGKLEPLCYTSPPLTNNEQKLCTSYPELIANIHSITKYESICAGIDQFNKFLKGQKTILSCFTEN